MNNVPAWIKREWEKMPPPKCERRKEGTCQGRMTKEHALTYGGKQIQELWAILDLCYFHHLGKGLNKRFNIDLAMSRAKKKDREKYPRLPWSRYE